MPDCNQCSCLTFCTLAGVGCYRMPTRGAVSTSFRAKNGESPKTKILDLESLSKRSTNTGSRQKYQNIAYKILAEIFKQRIQHRHAIPIDHSTPFILPHQGMPEKNLIHIKIMNLITTKSCESNFQKQTKYKCNRQKNNFTESDARKTHSPQVKHAVKIYIVRFALRSKRASATSQTNMRKVKKIRLLPTFYTQQI